MCKNNINTEAYPEPWGLKSKLLITRTLRVYRLTVALKGLMAKTLDFFSFPQATKQGKVIKKKNEQILLFAEMFQ